MTSKGTQAAALPVPQLSKLAEAVAGFSAHELIWASGYLFGLAQAGGVVAASGDAGVTTTASVPAGTLTILYGSQTGNAKGVAESIKSQALGKGLQVQLLSMSDFKPKQLKKETHLIIVTSTLGEGEPPENAVDLLGQLKAGKLGKLDGLKFAVLGLGDSSYEFFCQAGKDFDAHLEKAGAERVLARADLDVDYRAAAAEWAEQAVSALAATLGGVGGGSASAAPAVAGVATAHSQYDKFNPYLATLSTNQKITGRDSTKDIRHIEISLEGSGISYQPGDALGVWFDNDAALVAEVLALTGLTGSESVSVEGKSLSLTDALTRHFELTRLP